MGEWARERGNGPGNGPGNGMLTEVSPLLSQVEEWDDSPPASETMPPPCPPCPRSRPGTYTSLATMSRCDPGCVMWFDERVLTRV